MAVYYNEYDPHVAAWLRELIKAGLIAAGEVDERSIEDVLPADLVGFAQCHFFAGIGGWSYALRLAGWPDDKPVWTGSCPCQPFSSAGKGEGVADERHLWPAFKWLINQRRPARVFGEQVMSLDGRKWLAGVRVDLETMGYRVGAADLCAAGVGAPQIRQRIYWVADSESERRREGSANAPRRHEGAGAQGAGCGSSDNSAGGWLPDAASQRRRKARTNSQRPEEWSPWSSSAWVECADGKRRRIEPGLSPLVNGFPERVVYCRGYGNAISPQLAATFIQAAAEATS